MNEDIVTNEPGHEKDLNYHEGLFQNEAYSNVIRIGNFKFAIIDQLKNPPIGFGQLITDYFKVKAFEIQKDIELWIIRSDTTCSSYSHLPLNHNPNLSMKLGSSENSYVNEIKTYLIEFLNLLKEK